MPNIMQTKMAKPIEGNNIMIVDALNLAFRFKHSGKKEFAQQYLDTVNSLARSYGARHIIITSDLGSSTWRLNLYPEYKGDRREKVANQSEEEKQEFKGSLADCEAWIRLKEGGYFMEERGYLF